MRGSMYHSGYCADLIVELFRTLIQVTKEWRDERVYLLLVNVQEVGPPTFLLVDLLGHSGAGSGCCSGWNTKQGGDG